MILVDKSDDEFHAKPISDFADDFANGFRSDNDFNLMSSKLNMPTLPPQSILLVPAFKPARYTSKLVNKSRSVAQQCKTCKIIKPRLNVTDLIGEMSWLFKLVSDL